ncbi:MAG: hypothetical protein CFE23_04795 [Flavobacterium sp. BFFFF1]|uniref:nuclear transport factor 2 family protein n=1 Tax=Flavobacterium sp. BFFFF1 TaxID=2015557 RepID=UPI000BD53641|nr:nuclear transport factor 2 family protein [Flavobacterium sp. BFFFF1]OYU81407.1 MAG: hypothetical protein CFE23_04795 [Flavobacterium sp. BFFFF1]
MKKLLPALLLFITLSLSAQTEKQRVEVSAVLDSWHKAAAEANFEAYFSKLSTDAVFIGTDPTEHWTKDAFIAFAKPFFEKGKAWDFKALERHIYFSEDGKIAWFDELLDTWMKVCRGSGVLKKEDGQWKIAHYVLSITIPNDNTDEVIQLKANFDDKILEKLKSE